MPSFLPLPSSFPPSLSHLLLPNIQQVCAWCPRLMYLCVSRVIADSQSPHAHSAVLYLTTQSIFALLFGSYVSFLQVHGFCSVITLVTMIFCNTLNLPFLLSAFRDFPMLNSYYFYFHFPFSLPPFLSRLMIILFLLGQPFILFNYFYLLFKLVSSNAISWTLSIFYGPNNTIFINFFY